MKHTITAFMDSVLLLLIKCISLFGIHNNHGFTLREKRKQLTKGGNIRARQIFRGNMDAERKVAAAIFLEAMGKERC